MIKNSLDKLKKKIASFLNSNKQKNNSERPKNQQDSEGKDDDQSSDGIYPLW